MATVKGPLFSLGASGTLAGAVVFSTWKGRAYVRQHAIPANPRSPGQLSIRAMLKYLTQDWDRYSAGMEAKWDERAAVTNISPFNAYISYNLKRWGVNLGPSNEPPAAEDGTEPSLGSLTVTAQTRAILVEQVVNTANDMNAILVFRTTPAACGITRDELVQVVPSIAAETVTWLDSPLTVGTEYSYNTRSLTDVGDLSTATGNQEATPT